jgi:hypothetical protein
MRVELSNIDGYHTFATLEPAQHPAGYYTLNISTRWETAKDPYYEQTKASMLLSPEARTRLHKLFTAVEASV